MVNHLYTLLLNRASSPDLQPIDPAFTPRILTAEQNAVRQAVFPMEYPTEYASFVAQTVVLACQASPIWAYISQIDDRQPVFLGSRTSTDLLSSLSITLPQQFSLAPKTTTTAPASPLTNTAIQALLTQEYVANTDTAASTIAAAYGVYQGQPQSGIFSTQWAISTGISGNIYSQDTAKTGSATSATLVSDTLRQSARLTLAGEPGLTFTISGPTIPTGFNCLVTATNPMTFSVDNLVMRLKSGGAEQIFQAISGSAEAAKLASIFSGETSAADTVAAACYAYCLSLS